jgi:hypothetical protein
MHGARYRSLVLVDIVAPAPWSSPFFRLVGNNVCIRDFRPSCKRRWSAPTSAVRTPSVVAGQPITAHVRVDGLRPRALTTVYRPGGVPERRPCR